MAGKISDDADKTVTGAEKVAAASGGTSYGILISSIAAYLASLAQTLTNKTINAANNTITGLTTAMFAANVVDNDSALTANSSTRLPSQAAVKAYVDAVGDGDVVGPGSATDNAAARFDTTTGKLLQNSALLVADTTAALSRSGNGGIPVQGTNTNDDAAAGFIGEHVLGARSYGSALALTSGVAANIASISLTPGDYEVVGSVAFIGAAATSCTVHQAGISTTSATLPGTGFFSAFTNGGTIFTTGAGPAYTVGPVRISITATTTVYFVGQAVFSGGTMSVYGLIRARRVR